MTGSEGKSIAYQFTQGKERKFRLKLFKLSLKFPSILVND